MNAADVTRQSGSNLALAFVSLGRERRADITVFYAFCRLIDDIADSAELTAEQKREQLGAWRVALHRAAANEPALAPELRRVLAKYSIAPVMLEEIIDGVEMDLTIARYDTFEELRVYCYRVASAVGLVSIEIFGYKNPTCRDYAVELGLALQTTNIIRDVAKDLRNGRVYIPRDELARFAYSETELQREIYNPAFLAVMQFQAARAWEFFDRARKLLPREDRGSMTAAEIMSSVYRALLRRIERDGFHVFTRDYRLTKWEKAFHVGVELLKFG